jgi:hypothetical protein
VRSLWPGVRTTIASAWKVRRESYDGWNSLRMLLGAPGLLTFLFRMLGYLSRARAGCGGTVSTRTCGRRARGPSCGRHGTLRNVPPPFVPPINLTDAAVARRLGGIHAATTMSVRPPQSEKPQTVASVSWQPQPEPRAAQQ